MGDLVIVAHDRPFRTRPLFRSTMVSHFSRRHYQQEKGLSGHMRGIAIAGAISMALTHDEFLDWYLHSVDFGRGCHGVDAAAAA